MKRSSAHRLLWRNASDGPGVYILRNLSTGQMYIGMTERDIPERIAEHCRSGKGTVQKLFKAPGKVEVVCDIMKDATGPQMLSKELEVGTRLESKYPGRLVNLRHLLGKSPKNNSEKVSSIQNKAVSSAKQHNTMTNKRKIIAVKPNGTWQAFNGVRECARAMGLDSSTVSKCLNGLRSHHEGNLFMDVPSTHGALTNLGKTA